MQVATLALLILLRLDAYGKMEGGGFAQEVKTLAT
jgi:hypothetical protein